MRRSLKSNKSVLLIFMIAIFTLISYFFDQLVIRQEDSLRNSQIKLENKNVEIDTLNSISTQLAALEENVWTKYIVLKRQRNYWFKSLLLLTNYDSYPFLTNKELRDTFYDKEYINEYIKNKFILYFINTIIATKPENVSNPILPYPKTFFYQIIVAHSEDLFPEFITEDNEIKSIQINFEDAFIEINEKIHFNEFAKYYNLHNEEKRQIAVKQFSLENWSDLHKFNYVLVNKLEDYLSLISTQYIKIDKKILDTEIIRDKEIAKISNSLTFKNYYILSSIISQVLSLFFLLILFRSLLKNQV